MRFKVAILVPNALVEVHLYIPESVYTSGLCHCSSRASCSLLASARITSAGRLEPAWTSEKTPSYTQVMDGVGWPLEVQVNRGAVSPSMRDRERVVEELC